MHIIAGKHKGRKVEVERGAAHVRPTSGFTRGAIFNILSHGAFTDDPPYLNKRVADICCGSGAFGLEALSRGAAHVTFVDMDHHTLLAARENADRLEESANVSFLRANATHLPPAKEPYALLFVDPPYFSNLLLPIVESLLSNGWADANSLIVTEHDAREQPPLPPGLEQIDQRRYGRTYIRLLKPAAYSPAQRK